MMKCLIFLMSIVFCLHGFSQSSSDYIVIKKKNNRTIHTYFAGGFISAQSLNGFNVNGYIKAIRNDSIFVIQQSTQLAGTAFGSIIDTSYYTIGFDYREIFRFNTSAGYGPGFNPGTREGGFISRILPTLMTLGGAGYLILELVNGSYRHESVDAHHKLPSLIVAAGVAAAGITWSSIRRRSENSPEKYQVIYVRKK